MTVGNIKRIDLSSSIFSRMREKDCFLVDKSLFIEHFLGESSDVQLITRQRRLGKSLNMNMLAAFLTDKKDNRALFSGMNIEKSPVWEKVNSAPVFCFDFKGLTVTSYKETIVNQIEKHISTYIKLSDLEGNYKRRYTDMINNPGKSEDGLLFLTELVYELTGKRSYILIDEYDSLLMNEYGSDKYEEIRKYETALLTNVLKGNPYLEKALLTGVMRISRESIFSGLNNIKVYDIFSDTVYINDFGFTEEEIAEIAPLAGFNTDCVRAWYNGVRINGETPVYNVYSVMSFIDSGKYECYWGRSGTLNNILKLMNEERKETITRLLNGERLLLPIERRISLEELYNESLDKAFYSLLAQAGYLSIDDLSREGMAYLFIPNKELFKVWKDFILDNLRLNIVKVRTLFDNADDPAEFALDLEYFLTDRLSVYDLAAEKGTDKLKTKERIYHVFLLGMLSAFEDVRCQYPKSNRESGDGRYDIFVEKPERNYIFEFKSCKKEDNLEKKAAEALKQIDEKRYNAGLDGRPASERSERRGGDVDLSPPGKKPLIKAGIAFCGKLCKVCVGN